jgi:hypothetical protein
MGGYSFGKKKKIPGFPIENYTDLEKCPQFKTTDIEINGRKVVFCKACTSRIAMRCCYDTIRGEK